MGHAYISPKPKRGEFELRGDKEGNKNLKGGAGEKRGSKNPKRWSVWKGREKEKNDRDPTSQTKIQKSQKGKQSGEGSTQLGGGPTA